MNDSLSLVFGALSDPTRRAIVERLRQGPATLTELAEPFDMTVPGVSKHIRVLERAGLLQRGRQAQARPCELKPRALRPLDVWLNEYRALWDARLDRLDAYVDDLNAQSKPAPPPTDTPPHS